MRKYSNIVARKLANSKDSIDERLLRFHKIDIVQKTDLLGILGIKQALADRFLVFDQEIDSVQQPFNK